MLVARMLNVSPDIVESAIKDRFDAGRNKTLVNKVYEFFSPAKLEQGTIISDGGIEISNAAIQEIPSGIDVSQLDASYSYPADAALIEIHRADRDENKHGWRAIIRDISEKKIRMELDISINPENLYAHTIVRGDVVEIEEIGDDGDYHIKAYHLIRLIE